MRARSFRTHSLSLLCFGVIVLPTGFAFAAQPALETVVSVATREDTAAANIAHSISQVGRARIAFVGQSHIQEVMLRIPGANLHRGSGQEYLPAIRSPVLTGAGGCGVVLMLEDNIPLRPAGFCNINELAEGIEIQRGPGSAYYGSNALHGVVNVLAVPSGLTPGLLGVDAGPHDYRRLRLSLSTEAGGIKVTAAHDGGFRRDSGFDQQKLTAWRLLDGAGYDMQLGMTLVNLEQETAGYIEGLNAYKDSALAESNPNPEAFRNAVAGRAWSRLTLPVSEQARLRVAPYVRWSEMEFLQHFLPGDPLEENGQASVGVQSGYYASGPGELPVGWTVGLDAEFTSGFLQQGQDRPTPGSAFLRETVPVGKHYDYDVEAGMAAGYASLDWQATPRLAITAGIRYEYLDRQPHAGWPYPGRWLRLRVFRLSL